MNSYYQSPIRIHFIKVVENLTNSSIGSTDILLSHIMMKDERKQSTVLVLKKINITAFCVVSLHVSYTHDTFR